jgi:hypothetical protein
MNATGTCGDRADKYETKQTGLTFDEATEAAVWGYRVRCPSLPAEAYIHYEFDGLRIQFVHNGVEGSSSGWRASREAQLDEWAIVPLPSELKRDGWGKPIVAQRDSWGRPV